MTHPDVTAAQYTLSVSSRAILDNVLTRYDRTHGNLLTEALGILSADRAFVLSPAGIEVTAETAMTEPTDLFPGVHLAEEFTGVVVLETLINFGYVSSWVTAWTEFEAFSYVDRDLCVDTVTVERAFTVTPVMYRYGPGTNYATGASVLTDVAVTVPAGNYVVTRHGDRGERMDYYGGGFLWTDPLPITEGIAEWEGVSASRMLAGCDNCEGRWFAESGSWHFRADEYRTMPDEWEYDESEWTEDGRMRCPYSGDMSGEDHGRCVGHVGFMVA